MADLLTPPDEPVGEQPTAEGVPRIPASAGAMIWDRKGRLLVLNPTYKKGWTIPGGIVEATGETPWEACRRETFEECGIRLESARLVCVDMLRPRPGRPGGLRFLFDAGRLPRGVLAGIVLQAEEIAEHRFVDLATARTLLSGPVRRRVTVACAVDSFCYLEDGRPVAGVRPSDPG